jgi:hypothetical protein
MRELYKKWSKLYDLVNKKFAGPVAEKKPAQPKKTKTPAAKKTAKKTDKENKNPTTQMVKTEGDNEDDEDQNTTRNEEGDEIRASAQDQSRMADLTTMENPLLESTTNVGKRGASTAAKVKKQAQAKFDYVHRISYTCLQQLLEIYFGYLFIKKEIS